MRRAYAHLRHHGRFYLALAAGVLVLAVTRTWDGALSLVLAGDGFFAVYLGLTTEFAAGATPSDLRERARFEDEGPAVILVITVGAIATSLASIFSLLGEEELPERLRIVLAIASVSLGWVTLHTVLAFRYAHSYYRSFQSADKGLQHAGGLAFPDSDEPGTWDFLYFAFVIGMTAQVSDVQVVSSGMRRLTLVHGIASFFFNTVLLALAINLAAGHVH